MGQFRDPVYSRVTVVNDTVLYTGKFAKKLDFKLDLKLPTHPYKITMWGYGYVIQIDHSNYVYIKFSCGTP